MINSDPAGDCNVLWPGCPIKAARACMCPLPRGLSLPCSLILGAEMLRRNNFGQKKIGKKNHSLLRREVRTEGNVKLMQHLSCFASMLFACVKIASSKVQGWSNMNMRQSYVCVHQMGTEFQTGDQTHLTVQRRSHAVVWLQFSCFKYFLIPLMSGAIFTFMRGSPVLILMCPHHFELYI